MSIVLKIKSLRPTQHVNHFPRMSEICRKDLLGRNLNRMRRAFPKDYDFFPRTWVLPAEYELSLPLIQCVLFA
jgi:tubulin polyglutamylase TTLL6/13